MTTSNALLSASVREDIERWAQKYPPAQRQSAVLPALLRVQEENNGWLTTELMEAVAEYLNVPAISVFEVATFYSMYELKPVGRYKIQVCTNISCLLSGADQLVSHLKKRLRIGFGETTEDGQFTLKEVECLAACAGAPACQINRDYYEKMTPEKIDVLLDNLAGPSHAE